MGKLWQCSGEMLKIWRKKNEKSTRSIDCELKISSQTRCFCMNLLLYNLGKTTLASIIVIFIFELLIIIVHLTTVVFLHGYPDPGKTTVVSMIMCDIEDLQLLKIIVHVLPSWQWLIHGHPDPGNTLVSTFTRKQNKH